ncbi:MAG TPA: hypothetical protein VH678_13380 [Xanthobacteraceae bacterium]|jgi:hypothetical protein
MKVAHATKKRKMFQATMLVTRVEEWCVEASSADEARELLASGNGHRCHVGDCLQVELERLDTDA